MENIERDLRESGPDRDAIEKQSARLFNEHLEGVAERTSRMFAGLMTVQWIVGIIFAIWISPRTWAGSMSQTHIHVYAAIFLGGLISSLPVCLALFRPGWVVTRHAIAVGQMLTSALLIHLTGGRIETHFHVFGSLAFLAFFRDWRVLVTATTIVALDHGLRGIYWPQSVYGILLVQPWRFLEHAGWVLFEDIFLFKSITQSLKEMQDITDWQAQLEVVNKIIERKVQDRTQQLTSANQELDKRFQELKAANEKVMESERFKSEFLANVSHEFRTPLTLNLAPLESMLSGEYGGITDQQSSILQTMHNNSVRLLQIVNGLLDFSKFEAGQVQVKREPTRIAFLTQSILHDFEPIMRHRGLECRFEGPHLESMVQMDRYLYERILFNLLSNAVKFTPKEGRISVLLQLKDERLILAVSDTGSGIPQQEIKNLFRRFKQVEGSSVRRFEGTGLGLSMIKEFTNLLGGSVTVESAVEQGSTFRVECEAPIFQGPVEASMTLERSSASLMQKYEGLTGASPGQESVSLQKNFNSEFKILIAEDNLELASYMVSVLQGLAEIRVCQDGQTALSLIQEWKPDLLISDVMMPQKDGFTLCKEIKSNPDLAKTFVVLLTALTHREALLKGWEAGADEYLYKPFHPKELLTRVKAILSTIRLSRELEKMTVQIQRKDAVEQFASGVAHELRNPLATINNALYYIMDALKDQPLLDTDPNLMEFLELSVKEIKNSMRIANDLLDLSKPLRLNLCLTDLNAILTAIDKLVDIPARVKLVKNFSNNLPTFMLDLERLQQVFVNLVQNAVQAMAQDGEIILSTQMEEKPLGSQSWVRVTVQDTGAGIDEKNIKEIFEPLFTTKPKGTGIGLTICRKFVESHGGEILVQSKLGQGSTFTIRIPINNILHLEPLSH